MASLESAGGGTGWPAVAQACSLDELANDDQTGRQEQVEVDHRAALLSAAAGICPSNF